MTFHPRIHKRGSFIFVGVGLLALAALCIPKAAPWQSALPMSRPGQEELTFWVNHNGLEQLDVVGEVGFGDMARILMRRRANAPLMRALRDRFTFKTHVMSAIQTPDVFSLELTDTGLVWGNHPDRFVIGASQMFNLPLIVANSRASPAQVKAEFIGTTTRSGFPEAGLAGHASAGYFLRVLESEPGLKKGRLLVQAGGRDLETEVTFDVRPLANLRVHLIDENGKPAAARVYLTGSSGLGYVPPGSISRFTAMSAENFFHADGSFAVDMPSGTTLIEAARGQEYQLSSRKADLAPGINAPITIQLKRWVDMPAKGWYSSDSHIHANYTADQHQVIDLRDVRLYAHAEDLNNANMLVANSGDAFIHDIQYFEGKPNSLSEPGFVIYWNEEMRSRAYGHIGFFKLKQLVHPFYTGFPNTPNPEDYPANYDQAVAARKQDAAVTYVHPATVADFDTLGGAGAKELPVDLALGQVDAMDVLSNVDEIASMELWYRLLNCGFRLAISAGTDSFTNVSDHYTPGGGRVYVHSGNPLRYEEWVRAYKLGHSFATNGPVILFNVNGREAGEDLRFTAGSQQKVRVKATVLTQVPVDKLEIVINGKAVASRDASNRNQVAIEEDVPLNRSSWIAARAIGPWHRLILNDIQTFAHTSPVYVHFGDQRVISLQDAKFYDDWIEKLIAAVIERGRFTTPDHRTQIVDLFRRAQNVYKQLEREASPQ